MFEIAGGIVLAVLFLALLPAIAVVAMWAAIILVPGAAVFAVLLALGMDVGLAAAAASLCMLLLILLLWVIPEARAHQYLKRQQEDYDRKQKLQQENEDKLRQEDEGRYREQLKEYQDRYRRGEHLIPPRRGPDLA
jgi:hypothetical protein